MPRIMFRRDTSINWAGYNPVLHTGELGYETDTGKFKIGRDSLQYGDLPYASGSIDESDLVDLIEGPSEVSDAIDTKIVDAGAGMPGPEGDSAYEVAVANGFVGSEAAWLTSLHGAAGATGPEGPGGATGPPGPTGITVVSHGAVGSTARPSAPLVYWVGTAMPANALPYDLWLEE